MLDPRRHPDGDRVDSRSKRREADKAGGLPRETADKERTREVFQHGGDVHQRTSIEQNILSPRLKAKQDRRQADAKSLPPPFLDE